MSETEVTAGPDRSEGKAPEWVMVRATEAQVRLFLLLFAIGVAAFAVNAAANWRKADAEAKAAESLDRIEGIIRNKGG